MVVRILQRSFGLTSDIPAAHRRNFVHFYFEIAWWGMLNASILVFLAIYASRIGATPLQIGLLTASPALINLLFTFPLTRFAQGRPTHKITRWSAVITRLFYLAFIPLPVLFDHPTQVWIILGISLVMNIPGTILAVMFNSFLAENVPIEYRAQVVGVRNALLAASSMITAIAVGLILTHTPFETGYQIVFAIGFIGSMLSCLHLFLIRPVKEVRGEQFEPADEILPDQSQDKKAKGFRLDVFSGPFGRVLLVMFLFQVAVFLPNPLFPLYQVRQLNFNDGTISLGTSLFWIVQLAISTQIGSYAQRLGFKKITGIGTLTVSAATLVFMFSYQTWIYVICQLLSGTGWAMVNIGLVNYLLEKVPADDRPAHLAWYNLALNAAILLCGLLASPLIVSLGLVGGMAVSVAFRFIAGFVILRWG